MPETDWPGTAQKIVPMKKDSQPIRVQEIDWPSLLPWLVLLKSSRLAIHPPKLLLGLLMVFLLYFGGLLSDALVGIQVDRDEMRQHATLSPGELAQWQQSRDAWLHAQLAQRLAWLTDSGHVESVQPLIKDPDRFTRIQQTIREYDRKQYESLLKDFAHGHVTANPGATTQPVYRLSADAPQDLPQAIAQWHQQRRARWASIQSLKPRGVFESALQLELEAFERLVTASTSLNFGFDRLLDRRQRLEADTLLGAAQAMLLDIPRWLWSLHRAHLLGYLAYALIVWSLIGGAMARISAGQAARIVSPRSETPRIAAGDAIAFAAHRWLWFMACPLLPLALAATIGWGILSLSGLVWFNLPGLDVIGAMLFGLMLAMGMIIVLLLVGLAASIGLLTPALAIEGTDTFDAVSRCYNYVLGRPWQWGFYTLLSLIYGAVSYLFFGSLIFAAIAVTHTMVRQGVLVDAALGMNYFSAMLPLPQFGHLAYWPELSLLPISGRIAATLMALWVYACIGLLAAYAISYFLSANTWIYLLLRRSADGAEMDEIALPPSPPSSAESAATSPEARESTAANLPQEGHLP